MFHVSSMLQDLARSLVHLRISDAPSFFGRSWQTIWVLWPLLINICTIHTCARRITLRSEWVDVKAKVNEILKLPGGGKGGGLFTLSQNHGLKCSKTRKPHSAGPRDTATSQCNINYLSINENWPIARTLISVPRMVGWITGWYDDVKMASWNKKHIAKASWTSSDGV